MSLLRRHRAVRDVPEGDVITQTEPETDANGAELEHQPGEPDESGTVEADPDSPIPGVVEETAPAEDEPAEDEPQPEAKPRKRSAR